MCPPQRDANENVEAAFAQAIKLLQKNGDFADAFHLSQIQLERGSASECKLACIIKNAYESGRLNECADFLVALVEKHPGDADLLNYTAGLLGEMGHRQQSRAFAKRAAARKPFFPSRVRNARLRVLAMQCIATADYRYSPLAGRFFLPGLTNLYTILDPGIAVHRLLVDDLSAAMEAVKYLPKCDVVFNTISDPDYEEPLQNAATLCKVLDLPVFNAPCQVRQMNRASLPAVLHEKSDRLTAAKSVYLPPEKTKNSDITLAMQKNHLGFPVIIRAPGFQGGRHMVLAVDSFEELGEELYRGNGLYIVEFVDVSFQDRRAAECLFYPKYRAFFTNGQLFPIHLFVSNQYEVHKKTADPVHARYPWLLDMEAEYLQDPEHHLPEGLWGELKTAAAAFGLDYFGVDFAVSTRPEDSDRLVLFECNPAMRNKIVLLPEGDRVQRKWRDVTLAAHVALCTKSGVPTWPFALRKGLQFSLGE